ncbi:PaaI family thioesterase [Oceanibaculum pacificum]|nr:PaaI family thioesterase [Oceanibaculum pacificum]
MNDDSTLLAPADGLMETLIGLEPTSGFQQTMGYRLVEWREGYAALEMDVEPKHLNRAGVIHGGVAASLLDTVCGFSGCYCPDPARVRKAVTLSLTTQYLGQASAGTLRAVARVRGGGRKIFFCAGEVFGPDGTLIAAGEGTFRYRSGSEDAAGSPRE